MLIQLKLQKKKFKNNNKKLFKTALFLLQYISIFYNEGDSFISFLITACNLSLAPEPFIK